MKAVNGIEKLLRQILTNFISKNRVYIFLHDYINTKGYKYNEYFTNKSLSSTQIKNKTIKTEENHPNMLGKTR